MSLSLDLGQDTRGHSGDPFRMVVLLILLLLLLLRDHWRNGRAQSVSFATRRRLNHGVSDLMP
jgi:hypothetical protein